MAPPIKCRLLQISTQELQAMRVSIRRMDIDQDNVSGPLIRSLDNPEELVVHKPGKTLMPNMNMMLQNFLCIYLISISSDFRTLFCLIKFADL